MNFKLSFIFNYFCPQMYAIHLVQRTIIVLSCWRLGICMVAVSVICVMQFQYQKTSRICAKNKEAWYHFYVIISSAGLLLTYETFTSWIILHLSSDPFASCENIGFPRCHQKPPPPTPSAPYTCNGHLGVT